MSPQIEKQRFVNQSGGWIGAVNISVKGEELGVAVAPGDSVWLSEAEQILTANAPRKAEDNPFIPQRRVATDPITGDRIEVDVTPLVPEDASRFVPSSQRPIPSDLSAAAATQAAATGDTPVTPVSSEKTAAQREAEVLAEGDTAKPGVPPRAAAAAAAAAAQADQENAVQIPDETPEVETPAEETAAQSPGPEAEETGAATSPTGAAPQGEYAAQEEVGTPSAPTAAAAPQQPAPYVPGSTQE